MANATYIALGTAAISGTDSEIEFSSIPSGYRDLVLSFDSKLSGDAGLHLRINGDAGTNYSQVWLYSRLPSGTPLSASDVNTEVVMPVSGYTEFWGELNILDYSATDKHKSMLLRTNNYGEYVTISSHRWASLDAVTSVKIYPFNNTFAVGTTVSLYGIGA